MKIVKFYPVIISLAFILSCSSEPNEKLTTEQEIAIREEILTHWIPNGIKVLETLETESFLEFISKSDKAKIITYGTMHPDIETYKKNFIAWLESTEAYRQKVTFDSIYSDFINDKTVLISAVGTLSRLSDTSSINQPSKIAYTILWTKESEEWKALNVHVSH